MEEEEEDREEEKEKTEEEPAEYSKIKKTAALLKLLKRDCGASLDELSKELNWKKISLRGVLSNLQKQCRFTLLSINMIKPALNMEDNIPCFKKETRYFIKDRDFDLSLFRI
ncbi:MAG: DUF3489 domain-containing protein [Rickettsiales bacterium]|jgi:hypothetical protein|nr:DUF3489 domain-containing protein [Rickettsiales bacterium]